MSQITYVTGDATVPQGDGHKVIVHCCNNVGVWGAGFVMALSRKGGPWLRPEVEYKNWAAKNGSEKFRSMLGALQLVPVENDIVVGNILGQESVGHDNDGKPPIRYEAIRTGLRLVAQYQKNKEEDLSVHMPRMGCSLAGGSWAKIEEIINETLIAKGIPVTVYDWPGGTFNP